MKRQSLLVITTANQLEYTKMCINSISSEERELIDILLVDDASTDNTVSTMEKFVDHVLEKEQSMGLTDSWNQAYQFFKRSSYKNLIISNNDVLYPLGALVNIIKQLEMDIVVGPLSNTKGVEYYPKQNVNYYFKLDLNDNDPKNYHDIQMLIDGEYTKREVAYVDKLNGYFFGFNRDILAYEFSPDLLFDPSNINVGNEDELWQRMDTPLAIQLNSFVYHFKGISFQDYELRDESLLNRNLNWKEAYKYKNDFFYRTYIRIKSKFYSK